MPQQNYEKYWKLTVGYTDYYDVKFLKTLEMVVGKIDDLNSSGSYEYKKEDYKNLQREISAALPKTSSENNQLASTRKEINQCVKLGFVNSRLQSYHPNAKDYLNAKTTRKRKTLLSKIVYSNARFNSSTTKKHNSSQINFLINTLVEVGSLNKEEIIALMLVDIEAHKEPFILKEELLAYVEEAKNSGFIARKKNQISYLTNLLRKLEGIVFVEGLLYFTEDAKRIFGEDLDQVSKVKIRNKYLHLLYKNQLFEESEDIFNNKRLCMLEKLEYPVLIASHIKPFILSDEREEYDPNNGLLLSRTIDSLFDLKYLSFNDDGAIIFSNRLSKDVVSFWKDYKLDNNVLNEERKKYLGFHRGLLAEQDSRC